MSQKNRILEYLKTGKSLTTASAVDLFKIYRLSERIRDIEKMNHTILREHITTEDGTRFTEYSLCGIEDPPKPKKKTPVAQPVGGDLFQDRTNAQFSDYES